MAPGFAPVPAPDIELLLLRGRAFRASVLLQDLIVIRGMLMATPRQDIVDYIDVRLAQIAEADAVHRGGV